jgi:hypothetical protein
MGSQLLHGCQALSNDLSAIKSFHIIDHYQRLVQALLASMQHHFWILVKLLDSEVLDPFKIGKPDLVVLCQQSWLLLKVADALNVDVEKWKRGEAYQSFDTFKHFVKKITCVCQ